MQDRSVTHPLPRQPAQRSAAVGYTVLATLEELDFRRHATADLSELSCQQRNGRHGLVRERVALPCRFHDLACSRHPDCYFQQLDTESLLARGWDSVSVRKHLMVASADVDERVRLARRMVPIDGEDAIDSVERRAIGQI